MMYWDAHWVVNAALAAMYHHMMLKPVPYTDQGNSPTHQASRAH